ncbi:terminase gpP N-terminus-related DNA-binding protein [Acidiphilium sp. 20-67-58]|uniref:terminase gpP N-terminus-related DNA-binding protein n=1 Tax=Acidiphilium sp. 20-67-58 TaxID=1970291 RepID=UPI0026996095
MTLPETLRLIGWSVREFARRIGKPEDTVRAWVRRDNAPAWAGVVVTRKTGQPASGDALRRAPRAIHRRPRHAQS